MCAPVGRPRGQALFQTGAKVARLLRMIKMKSGRDRPFASKWTVAVCMEAGHTGVDHDGCCRRFHVGEVVGRHARPGVDLAGQYRE
jgi:hypothetical protein